MRNSFYWFQTFLISLIGHTVATGFPKLLWGVAAALALAFTIGFQIIEQSEVRRINKFSEEFGSLFDDMMGDKKEKARKATRKVVTKLNKKAPAKKKTNGR